MRIELKGAWHGENLPGGQFVASFPGSDRIETHLGPVTGENLIWVRCSQPVGEPFKFAGQTQDNRNRNLEWQQGWFDRGPTYGTNPVLYDKNGGLHQARPENGSNGIRYFDDSGSLVTGDASYFDRELSLNEYIVSGGISVGTDNASDNAIVVIDGVKRLLEGGRCRRIRVNRSEDKFAITVVREDLPGVVFFWYNRDQLSALPLFRPIVKPDSPNPPKEDPPVPIDPTTIAPEAPNVLNVIREVAAVSTVDRTVDVVRGKFTDEVVERLGYFPWGRKDRDRFPDNNNNNDDGLTYRRADGRFEIYDIIAGDATGTPTFAYAGAFLDGENGYFREVPRKGPSVPPGGPVGNPPAPPIPPDYEALKSAVGALQAQMQQAGAFFQEIATRLEKLEAPRTYKVTCGRAWGHAHTVTVEESK